MQQRRAFIVAVFLLCASACGSTESGEPEPPVAPGTWLRARWLVMEDGARQPAGFWDQKNQFACSFQLAADGRFRCLPSRVVVPFDAYPRDRCLPKPDFRIESRDPAGCSGWRHVLREATSEEIPPRQLARSWQILEGDGRIAAKIRVSIDGAREFIGWYDRKLGVSCWFGSIDETTATCLPHGHERPAPVSGSTCDGPVAQDVVMEDCDGSDPPFPSPDCPEEGAPTDAKYDVVVGPAGAASVRRVGGHASGAFSNTRTGKGGITTCVALALLGGGLIVGGGVWLARYSPEPRVDQSPSRLRAPADGATHDAHDSILRASIGGASSQATGASIQIAF